MMTVMLIRRNLRRTAATTSPFPSPSPTRQHQQTPSSTPYPGGKTAFRNTYYPPIRAMRYYRVWIYTCNMGLLISVVGFAAVASNIFIFDPRRSLIPLLSLTHPSFLYTYGALISQSGVLQAVGCYGAKNLNERLLNTYWLLLLLLLLGDIIVGIFWIYHFEYIISQMGPLLKQRFLREYGKNADFNTLWDMVQREDNCCGADSYEDYYINKTSVINWGIARMSDGTARLPGVSLPSSCCQLPPENYVVTLKPEARRSMIQSFTSSTIEPSTTTLPPLPPIFSTTESISVTDHVMMDGIKVRCKIEHEVFYTTGCTKRLESWFRSRIDTLMVINYCVISFLKLCFLGILRYEIQEMIQKIKVLRSELQEADYSEAVSLGLQRMQHIRKYNHNGSAVGVAQPLLENNSRDRDSMHASRDSISAIEEHEGRAVSPLLVHREQSHEESTPLHLSIAARRCLAASFNNDAANDSDTNSYCALLIQEDPRAAPKTQEMDSYEMQDMEKILVTQNRTKT